MPTKVSCIVDTGGKGDYTSLNSADASNFNATGVDLVANDEYVDCVCKCTDGNADTAAVTITNFITDNLHYISIDVHINYRHHGMYPSSGNVYRLAVTGTIACNISDDFTIINFISVKTFVTSNNDHGIQIVTGTSSCSVNGCVVTTDAAGFAGHYGIYMRGSVFGVTTITNNIVYGFSLATSRGIYSYDNDGNDVIYNNTLIGNLVGIRKNIGSGSATIKGNITFGNTDDYDGTFHTDSDYNATDGTGCGQGTHNVDLSGIAASDIFFNAAGNNYLLKEGSPVIGLGANLTSISTPVDRDILGKSRGGVYDIGAHQYRKSSYKIAIS